MAKDIWWANIVFREFSAHYIEKTDEEIVKDVRESLVRLAKLDTSGTSFGAFMVARAMERHGSVQAKASAENGKLGGRPPKQKAQIPANTTELYDRVARLKVDEADARNCWEATMQRGGKDGEGRPVENFDAYLLSWCKTAKEKRSKSA